MLKHNRYYFKYSSSPETVSDYIKRLLDYAASVYKRDVQFYLANQIITNAKFLGWSDNFIYRDPEFLEVVSGMSSEDLLFVLENQAKILVDVAPATEVALEDTSAVVKMLPGTTPAGDLMWITHLLNDGGQPYVIAKGGRLYQAKVSGTQVLSAVNSLPYSAGDLQDGLNCEKTGLWPMPFLPETFSDHALNEFFYCDEETIEIVDCYEPNSARVTHNTKQFPSWFNAITFNPPEGYFSFEQMRSAQLPDTVQWDVPSNPQWVPDTILDHKPKGLSFNKNTPSKITNILVDLTKLEQQHIDRLDKELARLKVGSRDEAEVLRLQPEHSARANSWLMTSIEKLEILSKCSQKIGALVALLNKYKDKKVLIVQPRDKWVEDLKKILNSKGIDTHVGQGGAEFEKFPRIITTEVKEDALIDDLIIISVSAFAPLPWLDWLAEGHQTYTLGISSLGLNDHNRIPETTLIGIKTEDYNGPGMNVLNLQPFKVNRFNILEVTPEGKNKFKTVTDFVKAKTIAQKHEKDGRKFEIVLDDQTIYITGVGEI